jgi:hypothetical protein
LIFIDLETFIIFALFIVSIFGLGWADLTGVFKSGFRIRKADKMFFAGGETMSSRSGKLMDYDIQSSSSSPHYNQPSTILGEFKIKNVKLKINLVQFW